MANQDNTVQAKGLERAGGRKTSKSLLVLTEYCHSGASGRVGDKVV